MVIVTRSAYRKASESLSSSDFSSQNVNPPWCSSGKVRERRKYRKLSPSWEIQSSYPLRENIWEYLYEDKHEKNACKRNRRIRRQREKHKRCGKTTVIMCMFLLITVCMMASFATTFFESTSLRTYEAVEKFFATACFATAVFATSYGTLLIYILIGSSLWMTNLIPKFDKITRLLQKDTFSSLLNPEVSTAVDEECCFRMKYLAAELSRVEKTLRSTIRLRRAAMLTSHSVKADTHPGNAEYIQASGVTIGRNTAEWGGLVALWGIVPLWRAARPPHTVLALRRPTPADCWPFSGSQGELIVVLPTIHRVRRVSIEHVRPDAAKSAPKHFNIYGISANGTWIRAIKGEYRSDGPPKQYYPMTSEVPLKRIVFRVLSNQGNTKYTCLYRFHVYGVKDSLTIL